MARPAGISTTVSRILAKEIERLEAKANVDPGLDEVELLRMQKLLSISQQLVDPDAVKEPIAEEDLDQVVEDLKPKRDPTLFPKMGPKKTAKTHEPGG